MCSREEAENYRPITIAPSLGKMLEKVALAILKQAPDLNEKNHAYVEKRSCLTAICAAMADIESKKHEKCPEGCVRVLALSLDDASSAFECIPHRAIEYWCQESLNCQEIPMDKFVASYLARTSFALNEHGEPAVEIKKRYVKRTSPQGSILSPFFWRIFDMIFSEIFREFLDVAVEEIPELESYSDENFADDKYTGQNLIIRDCFSV